MMTSHILLVFNKKRIKTMAIKVYIYIFKKLASFSEVIDVQNVSGTINTTH